MNARGARLSQGIVVLAVLAISFLLLSNYFKPTEFFSIVSAQQINSDRIDVAKDATVTKAFKVYGLHSGNETVCIKVVGIQSGLEAKQCLSLNIQDNPSVPEPDPAPIPEPQPEPVPVNYCGDGLCEASRGENVISCPGDCPLLPTPGQTDTAKQECLERVGDGIMVLDWNWNETSSFWGFFAAGSCVPAYNWVLFGIVALLIIGIVALLLFKGK